MAALFSPLIGITLNQFEDSSEHYSSYPWATLRQNYFNSTNESGAIPVGLPLCNPKYLPHLLDKIDGLIISGEDFNLSLQSYTKNKKFIKTKINSIQTSFTLQLVQQAWERNMPVLGVAEGAQLLTLFLGGNLYEHFSKNQLNYLPHMQDLPAYQGSHIIKVIPNTILSSLSKRQSWIVNSYHQQSIKSVGKGQINALAEDGTIEGIEDPSRKFFVGVQWHPEFSIEYLDRKIFSALTSKAKAYAESKHR